MSITNWTITHEEHDLLMQVVDRAKRELVGYPDHSRTLIMDLNACHSNGCPLDFAGLLAAPLQAFSHDIYGIRNAIDRSTGKLTEDIFMPRYALPNKCAEEPHDRFGIRDEDAIAQEEDDTVTATGETIDITPVGLSTPEGVKRVEQAKQEWDSATHLLANTLKEMWDAGGYLLPEDRHQITALIGARDRKQEEFLRAVAGARPV